MKKWLAGWLCVLCCMQAPAWAEGVQSAVSAAQSDERSALSSAHSQCHPYFGKRRSTKKKKLSGDPQVALQSNIKEGKP